MRAYILVGHVIDEDTWLHGLGRGSFSYLSYIPFERLNYGYKIECRLGMKFFTWCIVKLDCYVNLFSAFHILIVANAISHMGIKMISWSWVVVDVTKTPDFSDHIQVNCLFFNREKYSSLKVTRSSKIAFLITGGKLLTYFFYMY